MRDVMEAKGNKGEFVLLFQAVNNTNVLRLFILLFVHCQKTYLFFSYLPHCLFVGLFDALPLGDGSVRHHIDDGGLVSACETRMLNLIVDFFSPTEVEVVVVVVHKLEMVLMNTICV